MKYNIVLRDIDGYTTVVRKLNEHLEFVPEVVAYDGCIYRYNKTIGANELIYDFESSYVEII